MNAIKGILSLIGLITLIGLTLLTIKVMPYVSQASDFEPKAAGVYLDMAKQLLETGNAAEATVWKVKVNEGLTPDEVEQSMKSIASNNNIKNVGELPLYREVAAMSGQDYRYVKIFMFCNALTAAKMLDFNDSFSAYLPCRIALIEDLTGQLWLYTLNMDMMIYGGKPLPPELKETALGVKKTILDIMKGGAEGDF